MSKGTLLTSIIISSYIYKIYYFTIDALESPRIKFNKLHFVIAHNIFILKSIKKVSFSVYFSFSLYPSLILFLSFSLCFSFSFTLFLSLPAPVLNWNLTLPLSVHLPLLSSLSLSLSLSLSASLSFYLFLSLSLSISDSHTHLYLLFTSLETNYISLTRTHT